MNSVIKSGARRGLSSTLLSSMVQNYIDFNTNLNPNYDPERAGKSASSSKPMNLISMAADILKVDRKLSDINNSNSSSSGGDGASNLISVMKDVMNKEEQLKKLDEEDEDDSDDSIDGAEATIKKKPLNLINIMGDLLTKEKKSGGDSDGGAVAKLVPRPSTSNEQKAKIIETLTSTLAAETARGSEPDFSLAWLLNYSDVLDKLDVEPGVKANFNKWALSSLRNMGSNGDEMEDLSSIPPAAMIRMVEEMADKDDGKTPNFDRQKVNKSPFSPALSLSLF